MYLHINLQSDQENDSSNSTNNSSGFSVGATFSANGGITPNASLNLANGNSQSSERTNIEALVSAGGATIIPCTPWKDGNRIPLHIVKGVTADMRIAQEEVFGPILPVVGYDNLDQAIAYVADQPHPLALYLFSTKGDVRDRVLGETRSGSVIINYWGWHVVNAAVPFWGGGNSGFGSYHGVEGFRELSNPRPIFQRATFFPTQMMYPPINLGPRGIFQRFWMNLYSKKGDPARGGTPYGQPWETQRG